MRREPARQRTVRVRIVLPAAPGGLFHDIFSNLMASVVTVIALFLLFSNDNYQLSLFYQLRHTLDTSPRGAAKLLEGIQVLEIDPETQARMNPTEVVAQSIEALSGYARNHAPHRLVAGLDFSLTSALNRDQWGRLAKSLSQVPDNLFLVFGGLVYADSAQGVQYFNAKELEALRTIASEYYPEPERQPMLEKLRHHVFLASIHFVRGRIAPGWESDDGSTVALGYVPAWFGERPLLAMPPLMALLSNPQVDLVTTWDGAVNQGTFNEAVTEGFLRQHVSHFPKHWRTGTPLRYDFFLAGPVSQIKSKVISWKSLQNLQEDEGVEASDLLDHWLGQKQVPEPVDFFVVGFGLSPESFGISGNSDAIMPIAEPKDATTLLPGSVSGYTAHVIGLSNLRTGNTIRVLPPVDTLLWCGGPLLLLYGLVWWRGSTYRRLFVALGWATLLSSVILVVLAFLSFWIWGILVPLRFALMLPPCLLLLAFGFQSLLGLRGRSS